MTTLFTCLLGLHNPIRDCILFVGLELVAALTAVLTHFYTTTVSGETGVLLGLAFLEVILMFRSHSYDRNSMLSDPTH